MLDTTTYTWYSLNTMAANETENIYSNNQESSLPTLDAFDASISGNNDKITFIFIIKSNQFQILYYQFDGRNLNSANAYNPI